MGERVNFKAKHCLLKWQRGHRAPDSTGAPSAPAADVAIELASRLSTTLQSDPMFVPVAASLLHAWGVARCKLGPNARQPNEIGDGAALELESKFTKFLCPALHNMHRLKVSDDAYDVPYAHLLSQSEVNDLGSGVVTLFDVCRAKSFGARVVDTSALQVLEDTAISLQHMDPARTRKLVQRYENLPRSDTAHIPHNSASLLHLIALGSPDWDLTTFDRASALAGGWSASDIAAFDESTMLSPLAVLLTWLVDKTDDAAVMFYYDSPANNGGLQSESGNRSGCAVRMLQDSFDLVNLATWVAVGAPADGTQGALRWATTHALTIEDFQRTLAAVSILLKVDPENTKTAMSVFFSQSRGDPVGRSLTLGGAYPSRSVHVNKPSWPPGITATNSTLAERREFASEAHCRRILGDVVADKILSRACQPTPGVQTAECDQLRYTHVSAAHPAGDKVLVNPGELPRLLPPWQSPMMGDPRHAAVTRGQRKTYIAPPGHNGWHNASSRRGGKGDGSQDSWRSHPRVPSRGGRPQ